jgi:energy-coupling factor transporter ATP-binding protein EcfA2
MKTQFQNNKSKPKFKKMYYPKFINEDNNKIIKNDCNLTKNMIITGPNASGKTTTIKSSLINIILSQQIGFGCFESLKLSPYDNIHCYLNIPDTSNDLFTSRIVETHIVNLMMIQTGTYNQMYGRPYNLQITQQDLNKISNKLDDVGQGRVTGNILANIAANIIQPKAKEYELLGK